MTFQGDGCPPVEPSRSQRARRKALTIVLPTGVALGAGAAIAYAAIPSSDGTIGACFVPEQTVRFVDGPEDCKAGPTGAPEQFVKFNQTGPAGPAGAPGAPGAPGGSLAIPAHPIPASDYLLEIDGIKGESSDKKHKETIEISSYSWGATNSGSVRSSGGGGGAGKVSMRDFTFVKAIDKSSPLLFKRAATGQHIKKATLFVRKSGGDQQEYMKITLSDCIVSSYQTKPQPPGSGAGPVDQFSLNFAKIEYSYKPTLANGALGSPVTATYDIKAAKK